MTRFVLAPFGSGGDVNPFIWLGRLLRARGHEVVMVTVPMFEAIAKKAGLEFRGVGSAEAFEALVRDPRLWQPLRGTELVFRASSQVMEPFFEAIREETVKAGKAGAVIVAPFQVPSARLAREVLKAPLVTVHLQPVAMFSAFERSVFLQGLRWVPAAPWWVRKGLLALPNPADFVLLPEIRRLCVKHGVAPPKRLMQEWGNSPDGVLCLWPEWFAERQPDWPARTVAAGFPLEDLRGQFELPGDLRRFLEEENRPVLFTAGTGNAHAREFFAAGLAACERLGKRMLAGTKFRELLPEALPSWARHFDYLPFGEVLPWMAALVHHGGIGTMSQAFAAGVPQVVAPLAHDQPDNGARMERLGVGTVAGKLDRLEGALRRVLLDEGMQLRCAKVAARCRQDDAAGAALALLEEVTALG